jgi:hypothetical protein
MAQVIPSTIIQTATLEIPQTVTVTTPSTSTTASAAATPQATHGPSAVLIGAVVGGIVSLLIVSLIIVLLLKRRRNAALLSTQTETHTGSRILDRIFHTRPPADTTPFHIFEAETGVGRDPTDLNRKQGMTSHGEPALVTQPSASAMPAESPVRLSANLSIHQSEGQPPSYITDDGSSIRGHTIELVAPLPENFNGQRMMGERRQTGPQPSRAQSVSSLPLYRE